GESGRRDVVYDSEDPYGKPLERERLLVEVIDEELGAEGVLLTEDALRELPINDRHIERLLPIVQTLEGAARQLPDPHSFEVSRQHRLVVGLVGLIDVVRATDAAVRPDRVLLAACERQRRDAA